MNIALPLFGDEISPRLDHAGKFLIARVQEGKVTLVQRIKMEEQNAIQRAQDLVRRKVNKVICGGVDDFSIRIFNGMGIEVIPWVSGDAREALDSFLKDRFRAGSVDGSQSAPTEGGEKMAIMPKVVTPEAEIDDRGFLCSPEAWNEDVACLLAEEEIPGGLTEDHWKVIDYLRRYFLEFKGVPPVTKVRRDLGINLQDVRKLFPSGLARGACRIAGIPMDRIHPLYP